MLVLTRKLGEQIVGDDGKGTTIKVTVLEIRSGQVKLGIDAPKEFKVDRKEIADKIARGETRHGSSYRYARDFEDLK